MNINEYDRINNSFKIDLTIDKYTFNIFSMTEPSIFVFKHLRMVSNFSGQYCVLSIENR